ncbi:queuosine-tRNA galactosyltransferase isoform X2 [Brachyistius frenatus]|uniref:queuosine-tRNA galactosyltransferase isoform X2 n=2 Tax=Brachyistius frenatus TaxID=100188 RepID=UPI0037E860ED
MDQNPAETEPRTGREEREAERSAMDVCVILPVYNASCWLDECLQAVLQQDFNGSMELSVFDDASTWDMQRIKPSVRVGDDTCVFRMRMMSCRPKEFVCSTMCLSSTQMPWLAAESRGCRKDRQSATLAGSTHSLRSSSSHRNSTQPTSTGDLHRMLLVSLQCSSVYTSHGPTVVMPTWFCSRKWYLKVGPFDERGKGVPEDLLFFYQSLRQGGRLFRVDRCLLIYRYHEKAATHSVTEETIWKLRVNFLQERVLSQWENFTIWNAGKQGRKLYRCLSPTNQKKVKAFCDVDENKIQKGFYTYEESEERPKPRIPILHYSKASAPFVICVKLDMTGGVLEEKLDSLQLKEGTDYFHFN